MKRTPLLALLGFSGALIVAGPAGAKTLYMQPVAMSEDSELVIAAANVCPSSAKVKYTLKNVTSGEVLKSDVLKLKRNKGVEVTYTGGDTQSVFAVLKVTCKSGKALPLVSGTVRDVDNKAPQLIAQIDG